MYDTVLLTTDGSDDADETYEHATAAAEAYGATLHVLSVVDRREILAADAEEKDAVRDRLHDTAVTAVEDLAARAREAGLEATTATPEGVPHREILAYADGEDIGLLVLGTRGRTGPEKRLTLGSTTERVLKGTDRPMLVVDIG